MYRALAWKARQDGISWDDEKGLASLARRLRIRFSESKGARQVWVGRTEVTGAIRTPEMDQGSSIVSVHPGVRKALVAIQQCLGREGGVVVEGRDTTSVVFPHAEVKVFLTASLKERARRRLRERGGSSASWHERDLKARDGRDTRRKASPLTRVRGAIEIDTSRLTIAEQVEKVLAEANRLGR